MDETETTVVTYTHFVNVYMLKKLLDGVTQSGGVKVAVEHIDRWGKSELRAVAAVGTMEGDDGSRYLVFHTIEGRDGDGDE